MILVPVKKWEKVLKLLLEVIQKTETSTIAKKIVLTLKDSLALKIEQYFGNRNYLSTNFPVHILIGISKLSGTTTEIFFF